MNHETNTAPTYAKLPEAIAQRPLRAWLYPAGHAFVLTIGETLDDITDTVTVLTAHSARLIARRYNARPVNF